MAEVGDNRTLSDGLMVIGLTCSRKQDRHNAQLLLRLAITLDPQNQEVMEAIACFLHETGAMDALLFLQKAIHQNPTAGYEIHLRFAASYPSCGGHPGAAHSVDDIALGERHFYTGWNLLSTMQGQNGRDHEALTEQQCIALCIFARLEYLEGLMKTNEEDDEDQTRWMHVLYKAFAAFPHILTPLLVRARLSYNFRFFDDVEQTLLVYLALCKPQLLSPDNLRQAETDAEPWLFPDETKVPEVEEILGRKLSPVNGAEIVDNATGRCKLPPAVNRSSEELSKVGRLLCEAGKFQLGLKVLRHLVETDPCCGDAWGDLIEILSRRSTAEAEETLQLAESAFREPSMRMAKGCPDWATFYVLARVSIDNRNVFANNHMAHMGSASDVFSDLILHEPRIARNVPPTRDAVPGPSTLTPSGSGAPAGGSLHQAQKRQQGQRSPMPAMFPGPGLQVSSVSPPSQIAELKKELAEEKAARSEALRQLREQEERFQQQLRRQADDFQQQLRDQRDRDRRAFEDHLERRLQDQRTHFLGQINSLQQRMGGGDPGFAWPS